MNIENMCKNIVRKVESGITRDGNVYSEIFTSFNKNNAYYFINLLRTFNGEYASKEEFNNNIINDLNKMMNVISHYVKNPESEEGKEIISICRDSLRHISNFISKKYISFDEKNCKIVCNDPIIYQDDLEKIKDDNNRSFNGIIDKNGNLFYTPSDHEFLINYLTASEYDLSGAIAIHSSRTHKNKYSIYSFYEYYNTYPEIFKTFINDKIINLNNDQLDCLRDVFGIIYDKNDFINNFYDLIVNSSNNILFNHMSGNYDFDNHTDLNTAKNNIKLLKDYFSDYLKSDVKNDDFDRLKDNLKINHKKETEEIIEY